MQNPLETIAFQFGTSPTINDLVQSFNDAVDPADDIQNIYDNIWNIETAVGFGLDIWGAILDFPRNVTALTTTYTLDDELYRKMLMVKAAANISATNSKALNSLLSRLFAGRGKAFVIDIRFMQMLIVLDFELTPLEFAILQYTNLIPHPAGVKFWILQWDGVHKTFFYDVENEYCGGFDESYIN